MTHRYRRTGKIRFLSSWASHPGNECGVILVKYGHTELCRPSLFVWRRIVWSEWHPGGGYSVSFVIGLHSPPASIELGWPYKLVFSAYGPRLQPGSSVMRAQTYPLSIHSFPLTSCSEVGTHPRDISASIRFSEACSDGNTAP